MDIQKSLGQPSSVISHTPSAATAAVATVTKSSQSSACIYITGFIISATGAPAAAVEATLSGPSATLKLEIPAAAYAPITKDFSSHPLKCAADTNAVLTLPSHGGTVVGSVQLFYFYGPV
jgi:hypothetical protein